MENKNENKTLEEAFLIVTGKPSIEGSPGITGSWIPRALMKGFSWHLHVGSSFFFFYFVAFISLGQEKR